MHKINLRLFTFCSAAGIALAGCVGGKTALHDRPNAGPNEVAVVYRTTVHHPGGSPVLVISEVEEVDGRSILSSPRKSPVYREEGVIELLPGRHTIGVRSWSMVDDASFMFIGGAGTLVPGGSVTWHKPQELSQFSVDLKPGQTYVVFIPNAAAMSTSFPTEVCITEEAHDAPGHKTVPVGYGRTPSAQAKVLQCITQQTPNQQPKPTP